jgi:hypothetical protein
MYTIHVRFDRFRDINLSELIGAIGVYVIWDARAKARPTYIGEGNILKRFADHVGRNGRRFAHPWNGYAAIVSGSTHDVHKEESKAVERLLLDVANDTDRLPVANIQPGSWSAVLRFCRDETLRLAISRYDPLIPPSEAKPFAGSKEIKARVNDSGDIEVQHGWRVRRLRAPIM